MRAILPQRNAVRKEVVENGKASILASVEPVTATILGGIVFREKLLPESVAGVILVLAALYVASAENREKGTQS